MLLESIQLLLFPIIICFRFCVEENENKMGKIKRERNKYHITADGGDKTKAAKSETSKPNLLEFPSDAVQNIFAGINIQLATINKFEETPLAREPFINEDKTTKPNIQFAVRTSTTTDTESVRNVSSKNLTKKEKISLKHQKLMERLDVTQKARLLCQKNQQKQKKRINTSTSNQILLESSKRDIRSLITSAAIKPSNQNVNTNVPKNISATPTFNDDLPALNTNLYIQSKSKSISKTTKKGKKCFVKNYNFLIKAMAKKRS